MVASRRRGYRCAALHRITRGSYTLLGHRWPSVYVNTALHQTLNDHTDAPSSQFSASPRCRAASAALRVHRCLYRPETRGKATTSDTVVSIELSRRLLLLLLNRLRNLRRFRHHGLQLGLQLRLQLRQFELVLDLNTTRPMRSAEHLHHTTHPATPSTQLNTHALSKPTGCHVPARAPPA